MNKSQTITFDSRGHILDSCNSLFNISKLVGKKIYDVFPFLQEMKNDLKELKSGGNPLFMNEIAFRFREYRSICDFIFAKDQRTHEQTYTWMINDNSMHFHHMLKKGFRNRRIK